MEQITLNFDATGFDGYQTAREYLQNCTHTLRDGNGRTVYQKTIAMELDYSPTHWSQKISEAGDSRITLNDAEAYTEAFDDTRWIYYLIHKHIIKKRRNREELLKLKAEIEAQLESAA